MTPPPSARKHAPEIRALTGARVIPVLLIVLFHYHEWYGYTGRDWYDAVVSKGYIWVEFFFGLSGFILFYVYGPRFGERLRARAIGAFLAARVSRIYPLQLATLLVAVVVEVDRRIDQSRVTGVAFWNVPSYPGRTWDTLVSNVFMIQAWNIHDVMSWNPVAWFVSVEFLLYLACPALMMLAGARFGWRTMAIWAASIALLVTLAATSGAGLDITIHHAIFRGLADFGIGLSLGALFIACVGRVGGDWTLPTSVHTLAQIGVLAAAGAGFSLSGPPRTARDLMVAGPMFALIFVLAFDRGLIARALHARWLLKLGEWSFAIYMVQYTVMVALPVTASPWLQGTLAIAGSIVAGGLAWRFIERPVAEVMRRRLLKVFGLS
jgi:peptidoglycan/LPS O-acetylase OafA/YrhL